VAGIGAAPGAEKVLVTKLAQDVRDVKSAENSMPLKS
jgi:hypothetical protein